jgi:membrane protein YqaA with SNARE-associated domain
MAGVLALTIAIIALNPVEFFKSRLEIYGYFGIFLIMLFSSATIILPVPGLAAVFFAAKFLDPVLLGVAAGAGSALGESTGYFFGQGGKAFAEGRNIDAYEKGKRWLKKWGFWIVFAFAATPSPADIIGIAAGALGYPFWRFLLANFLGKTLKSIAIAYTGLTVLHLFGA